ncbi:D-alanine--D-alanine ligase [soil metagenome]
MISAWELWPFYLIYAPLVFVWLYYIVKAKAVWFFSPANPTLEFAGFEGESKKEMYLQLPEKYYPQTIFIKAGTEINELLKAVDHADFTYPFIVKPQTGMHALLFRKIEHEQQLRSYHTYMPVDYLVQTLIDMPMEFSVFHIRYPGEPKGKITGFILKDYLAVTGNGTSSLLQLIQQDARAKLREDEMLHKHSRHLNKIVPSAEKYYLSMTGNHNRGARFINLHQEIDDKLCAVFDKISNEAEHFYFGRYDLKCTSIEDLKAGRNICILEFNGAGAEPNHIYDCGMKYSSALKVIMQHWKDLYCIAKINNEKGVLYWSYLKGYKYLKNAKLFFKKMKQLDLDCAV